MSELPSGSETPPSSPGSQSQPSQGSDAKTPPSGTRIPQSQPPSQPVGYQPQPPQGYQYQQPPPAGYRYPPPRDRQSGTSVTTIFVALYMMVLSILNLCSSLIVVGCGGFLVEITKSVQGAGDIFGGAGRDVQETVNKGLLAANVVSILIVILGILGLFLAVALFVFAIGMLAGKSWAYIGAIILNAIYIGIQLFYALIGLGLNVVQIIFMVFCGLAIIYLLADENVKIAFGRD